MFEKVKAFFQNKVVKIVEGVVITFASAGLILGGVATEQVAKLPILALGVITAIEAVVTLIQGFFTKSE